jgi:hypothetical protein
MCNRDRLVVRKGTADRPRSTEVWAVGPVFLVVAPPPVCLGSGSNAEFRFSGYSCRPRALVRLDCASPSTPPHMHLATSPDSLAYRSPASFLMWRLLLLLLLLHPSLSGCSTSELQQQGGTTRNPVAAAPLTSHAAADVALSRGESRCRALRPSVRVPPAHPI